MGVKGRFEFSQKIIHFGTMTRPLNAEPIVKYENEGYDVTSTFNESPIDPSYQGGCS